ncbi:MAG: metallophosphatase family protein [Desulfarculaceae bacterium]|nr:metallophosphatase family protein [Desulfarculaceae bacterium]MCF8074120.1 metallophosphatase family protein [Desulfarculaceae bacterium]MCF8103288.1 metallophosphatase family protein [Desulfarculaceae bacterium]MCF8116854.1 metallophosphatase family protein [Desulfarculaceae bacterium]
MSRLAVLSDLHANLSALRVVRADLVRRGVDRVVVLGDLTGYLARPNRVVDAVVLAGWQCIAGNYDLAVLRGGREGADKYLKPGIGPEPRAIFAWTEQRLHAASREFLATLPENLRLDTPAGDLLAVHGSPDSVRQYVFPDHPQAELAAWLKQSGASILCLGHTHQPFVRRVEGGLVLNPGSVGKSKDGDPRASYALIDFEPKLRAQIVRLPWDIETEARLLIGAGLDSMVARLGAGR